MQRLNLLSAQVKSPDWHSLKTMEEKAQHLVRFCIINGHIHDLERVEFYANRGVFPQDITDLYQISWKIPTYEKVITLKQICWVQGKVPNEKKIIELAKSNNLPTDLSGIYLEDNDNKDVGEYSPMESEIVRDRNFRTIPDGEM